MFGFFKKNKQPSVSALFFKSNEAAFEYACQYCNSDLVTDNVLVALVEQAGPDKNGNVSALLKFASAEGGRTTFCPVADSVPSLQPGDLVAFKIFDVAPGVKSVFGIQGAVVAKLEPELADKGWKIAR